MAQSFFRQQFDPQRFPEIIRAKWSDSLLDEGFIPLPKRVMRNMHYVLKGAQALEEMAVLLAIADYRRTVATRHPSKEFLAFVAGMSEEKFSTILDQLVKRNLVEVEPNEDRIRVSMHGFLKAIDDVDKESNGIPI